ncbi:MAG TPA: hypothetical protein VK927_11255, partial [Adhaeribacter sp.]|nr:hypothetical protein [Adhaeribacter sp.]
MKVLEAQRPVRRHNLTGLIRIINRWKYLVLGVTLMAAIISIVVAKMLPNEYKSTAIFLPLNFSSVDPDRIVAGERLEIASTNEDIDRMITVGESHILADYIINKYDLYTHYGIDSTRDDANRQLVLEEFMSHYSIQQNPRDAIEVSYIDQDKDFAANVANDIVNYIDTLNQQLSFENRRKALALHKNNFDFIGKEYSALKD